MSGLCDSGPRYEALFLGQISHVLLQKGGMVALIEVQSASCVILGKKKSTIESRAKRVPRFLVAAIRFIHMIK